MKKIIAKTMEGKEFIYSRKSSYSAPKTSAQKICDALNRAKWGLKDGEKWHVYEIGDWELDYMAAGYQRLSIRNGRIYEGTV